MGKLTTLANQLEERGGCQVDLLLSSRRIILCKEGHYYFIDDYDLLSVMVKRAYGPILDKCLGIDLVGIILVDLNKNRGGKFTWVCNDGFLEVRMTVPIPGRTDDVLLAVQQLEEEAMVGVEEAFLKFRKIIETGIEKLVRELRR